MARRAHNDASERRTAYFGFQVTPTEKAGLKKAAARLGEHPSGYARALLFRRSIAAAVLPQARQDAAAAELLAELHALGVQSQRIGNNLNQLTKHAHRTGHLHRELHAALARLEQLDALMGRAVEKVLRP